MTHQNIVSSWRNYRTGISLHSHTMYSRECLGFIPRIASRFPILRGALRRGRERFRGLHGYELDFTKGWWTPPLSARDALELERAQIENSLGLEPLVSLTDHDTMEAGATLQAIGTYRHVPISTEWTAPFESTFFHVGVHNVPAIHAHAAMKAMDALTSRPSTQGIAALLEWLDSMDGTILVLNHPCWDESGIGAGAHNEFLKEFIRRYKRWLHAVELNGLRPWSENRRVLQVSAASGIPLISGGDRHAHEPNAILNVSNAATFAEFAAEVKEGHGKILFMPQYHEPFQLRILHNLCDVLSEQHGHAKGWRLWSDRVFFELEDGTARSLTEWFGDKPPLVVDQFVKLTQRARCAPLSSLFRLARGLPGAAPQL